MFPLVSSQALTLEWIGLDMLEDSTGLRMHSQQISTTCILSTVVTDLPLISATPKCENSVSLLPECAVYEHAQPEEMNSFHLHRSKIGWNIKLIFILFEEPGAHQSDGDCSLDGRASIFRC